MNKKWSFFKPFCSKNHSNQQKNAKLCEFQKNHACSSNPSQPTTEFATAKSKNSAKLWRALACSSLAILMSGTAFLGTACSGSAASMNAGQGSAAGVNYGSTASNLIFDDTSEPVFTTKSGVEIRYATAPATSIDPTNGFYYFNLGTCNGTAIRWLMLAIGVNPPTDPAGSAISSQIDKQTFATLGKDETTEWGHAVCVSADIIATQTLTCSWEMPPRVTWWDDRTTTGTSLQSSELILTGVSGVTLGVMSTVSAHTYNTFMGAAFYAGSQNLTGSSIVGFSSPALATRSNVRYIAGSDRYNYAVGVILTNIINNDGIYFESSLLAEGAFWASNNTNIFTGTTSGSATLTGGAKAQLIMDLDL